MGFYITDKCVGCQACSKICPVNAIAGEKKKQHQVNQAVCIECGACGRVCPKNALTDCFGLATIRVKKSLWEKPVFRLADCMACGICIDACPVGCLQTADAADGYPELAAPDQCIACGFCRQECPVDAISMELYLDVPT